MGPIGTLYAFFSRGFGAFCTNELNKVMTAIRYVLMQHSYIRLCDDRAFSGW